MASVKKRHSYEFGGPFGTFALTVFLPVFVLAMGLGCNDISGCPAPALLDLKTLRWDTLKHEIGWPANGVWGLASFRVTAWVLAYYLLNLVLYRVLPAAEVDGTVLASGGRLKYRFNSFYSNMLILSVCAAGTFVQGANFPVWTFISDNHVQIAAINTAIAFSIATFVYVRSFTIVPGKSAAVNNNRELAPYGCTGSLVYDWFMGRELNPRVELPLFGEVDLKQWCELRPGMLGWVLLDCAWVAQQYRNYGYVTDSILFITAAQTLYVIDSWYNEPAILTTIDMISEGFGFMLAFGDIGWLPFVYSVQARYLAMYPVTLGPFGVVTMLSILALAFWIFRSANSEKNAFRRDPNDPAVAHLEYITTASGSKLLTSGWWGIARHINYLGDWLQVWPYCLPTGMAGYTILTAGTFIDHATSTEGTGVFTMLDGRQVVQGSARGMAVPITYFYVVYFAVLLIHREMRDDAKCAQKYGRDWVKYRKAVNWRILPGVY